MSIFREVWHGQRSLGEMFWFWRVLIAGIILNLIVRRGVQALVVNTGGLYPLYLYIAFVMPYHIWTIVGLWRSASNSYGCWAGGVKVLIVIGLIMEIGTWIYLIFSPDARSLLLLS